MDTQHSGLGAHDNLTRRVALVHEVCREGFREGLMVNWAWPQWPPQDDQTGRMLLWAALAGRWAISGPPSPLPSFLAAVAPRVAMLAGRKYAVMTSSGSSAIVIAMQALGLGPGSCVLVPAL